MPFLLDQNGAQEEETAAEAASCASKSKHRLRESQPATSTQNGSVSNPLPQNDDLLPQNDDVSTAPDAQSSAAEVERSSIDESTAENSSQPSCSTAVIKRRWVYTPGQKKDNSPHRPDTKWHEIDDIEKPLEPLHGAVVRRGPPERWPDVYLQPPEEEAAAQQAITWENVKRGFFMTFGRARYLADHEIPDPSDLRSRQEVNLSFQDLGHPYQWPVLVRSFRLAANCTKLCLVANQLTSLRGFPFPNLEVLLVSRNNLTSFQDLPYAPKLRVLNMSDNDVAQLRGLEALPSVAELILRGNPVYYTINYRASVARFAHPHLEWLDDEPLDRTGIDLGDYDTDGSGSSSSNYHSGNSASFSSSDDPGSADHPSSRRRMCTIS